MSLFCNSNVSNVCQLSGKCNNCSEVVNHDCNNFSTKKFGFTVNLSVKDNLIWCAYCNKNFDNHSCRK